MSEPRAVDRAVEAYTVHALQEGTSRADWEESRSYAVEALTALLRENPHAWRYGPAMYALSAQGKLDAERDARR